MDITNEKKETTKKSSLPNLIILNSDGKFRYSGRKKGAHRIQKINPNVKISDEDIFNILSKSNIKIINQIPPNSIRAASGRYDTWILEFNKKEFAVVFGNGKNAGQKYEDEILLDLKKSHSKKLVEDKSELYLALLKAFNINDNQIFDIRKVSSRLVKRSISNKIKNVGSIISDIDIIKTNGDTIHISLKNKDGITIANSGYNGGFKITKILEERKTNILPFAKPGNHPLDDFVVSTLGIDKKKAADGLNSYIQNKTTNWEFWKLPTNYDEQKLTKYLASAYGYGYWYVRPLTKNRYQIIEFKSANDTVEKIGKINSVNVSYPYWIEKNGRIKNSKQITVWVDTTTATYVIEVRNSHREINPNEIKIKIVKSKTNVEN